MAVASKVIRVIAIGALLSAVVAVAGCRDEEQGRILVYKKGTYLGKPDQKLTEAQEQELRARTKNQAF